MTRTATTTTAATQDLPPGIECCAASEKLCAGLGGGDGGGCTVMGARPGDAEEVVVLFEPTM